MVYYMMANLGHKCSSSKQCSKTSPLENVKTFFFELRTEMRFSRKQEDLHLLRLLKAPIWGWIESIHHFQVRGNECDSWAEKRRIQHDMQYWKKCACEALISWGLDYYLESTSHASWSGGVWNVFSSQKKTNRSDCTGTSWDECEHWPS